MSALQAEVSVARISEKSAAPLIFIKYTNIVDLKSRRVLCVLPCLPCSFFFMNMPYPPSDRVALVSFIILGSYDTSPKAVDTTAKAAGIDDEALKIVNNFWTEPQFRDSMAQQQIDAIIYAPHKRLLIESYPSRVSCRKDLYVSTFASGRDRVFDTIRSDWEGS